jgi:hypothetical protein
MLFLPGLDSKTYCQRLAEEPLPEIPCPDPDCLDRPLRGHGWYFRFLDGVKVAFRRLRCPRCRRSHALLPEDVCAYQDLKLDALEKTLEAPGPTRAARAAGEAGTAAVRRARRRRGARLWQELWAVLPAASYLLEKIAVLVGEAPGRLLRLRRRLWRQLAYLLAGPAGLFRHGRPRGSPRRGST